MTTGCGDPKNQSVIGLIISVTDKVDNDRYKQAKQTCDNANDVESEDCVILGVKLKNIDRKENSQ